MRHLVIAICFCISVFPLLGQDNFLKSYAPVAPTPASLGKYGDIPVSKHTGLPNISIPIHTLSEGSISVPVSLSYHASGIKVQETASWVGLGWALNAGGVITRTVQGAPDEGGNINQTWGWYRNKGNGRAGTSCPVFAHVASGVLDHEPDIFNFNVGGYTGKFFYDKDTVLRIVSQQDVSIRTINFGTQLFSGWVLTDAQGTEYHFGATNSTMTLSNFVEKSAFSTDNALPVRNTSWYLSKIVSADGKDVINFSYTEEKYAFWDLSSSPNYGGINGAVTGGLMNPAIQCRVIGKRLSAITGTNGSIIFTGNTSPRTDLSNFTYCPGGGTCTTNTEARALKTIEIRDKNNNCLRKFDLNTGYTSSAPLSSTPASYLPGNGDRTDSTRLVLLSLTESACATSTNAKTHTFEYNNYNGLPRRLSFAQDHWGYFNGRTTNTTMDPGCQYYRYFCNNAPCANYYHTCTTLSTAREPAFPSMQTGSLKKITFPTGGFSEFVYEAHTAWGTGFDSTCVETNKATTNSATEFTWSASAGSCNNGASNQRTYVFTQDEIDKGHIELKWSNPFWTSGCSSNGYAQLEVYAGANTSGPIIGAFSTGGINNDSSVAYRWLKNIAGTLTAGASYTFKLTNTNGIGAVRIYTLVKSVTPSNRMVGGLRIKTITTNDGDATSANNIVRNFEYKNPVNTSQSSGKQVHKPQYLALFLVPCISTSACPDTCGYALTNGNTAYTSCPPTNSIPQLHQLAAYNSIQPMHTTMGSHIGYTAVQVREFGNGTSEYLYDMGQYNTAPFSPTGYPFRPPPYEPWIGNLSEERFFNDDGTLVAQNLYEYQNGATAYVSGYDAVKVYAAPGGTITAQAYNLSGGYSLLKKKTLLQYAPDGSALGAVTDIGYSIANGHFQKTTEETTNSDGTIYRTKYKYARDYPCPSGTDCNETHGVNAEAKAIYAMRKRNMVALPIEQTSWLKKSGWATFRLTGATYFQFDKVNTDYNNLKLKAVYQVRPAAPLTTFTESATSAGAFTRDAGYAQEYNFVFSDTHGKILGQWKQNDPARQQYIWSYNNKLPSAKVVNAESTEIAFTSFEEGAYTAAANGNWTLTTGGISTGANNFVTGKNGYLLANTRSATASITVPVANKKYVVSFWYRDGQLRVNNNPVGATAGSTWLYGETTLTLPAGANTVTVNSLSATAMIDELRLYPDGALMQTFSFDEGSSLLLSVADENNVAAHYEYDNFQRLQGVRDQDRNLIQTIEYNYRPGGGVLNDVKARTVLIAGQTTLSQVQALTGSSVRYVAQYFDGLARPVQTNAVGQSPAQNDIVSFQQYDPYGRENKQYLPYTIATNGGAYRTGFAAEQSTFINGFGAGGYGYAETAFDLSPLNRATAQSAPGVVWRLGAATPRYQRTNWRTNTAADAVRDFTNNTTFAANSLWMIESIDENGRSRFSFTDKMGRTVLVKQPLNATETAQTYTVYDDFGRVACVIPPETTKRMTGGNWDWTNATYANMVFKYSFDARGRMTAKTVPSAGTTTIAYDRLDRPVLTTDANGAKLYTRYDILSRPVASGRYVGAATAPSGSEPLFESPNTTAPHYYSAVTFPTDVANTYIYKVLYYDDYDFNNDGLLGTGETYANPSESGYDAAAFLRLRGKPTAAKTAILPNTLMAPSTYLTTRTYYDKEYAVIQVNKQNHLGGSDITHSCYDFANRLTKTRRDHTATPPGGTLKTYSIREEYVFDHAGRVRFVRHHLGTSTAMPTGGWVVTAAPLYDELGRLQDKRLHASNYDGTSAVALSSSFTYLQSLDYSYNIRGWLTGINDVASCAVQAGESLADVFSLKLDYDAPTGGGTAQYNGNISTMQWRTYIGAPPPASGQACLDQQQYRFTYDYANRLTAAGHYTHNGTSWILTNNYTESGITYDLNGNLKTYTRRGLTAPATFGTIDQLTYTYGDATRPDRLTQVADAGSITKGFVYNSAAATYQYDLNGNMTQDNHKGFAAQYNYLNLPIVLTKGANVITMTYTADGEKLTKAVTGGGATKNYVGGIEYSGANLEAIYHGEGRCTPNGATAFFYEYTVKDHLGNARVNFRANGAAIVNIEDHHYYPFGMKMEGIGSSTVTSKYTYNYKELNDDFGLNWHDYGARWYDAALGRWGSVDPMCVFFCEQSPYSYAMNSPTNFIDIFGLFPQSSIEEMNPLRNSFMETTGQFANTFKPRMEPYATDYYYDPDGNLVVVIPSDEPDRYFDVEPDGKGHWTVKRERKSKPGKQGLSYVHTGYWEGTSTGANVIDPNLGTAEYALGVGLQRRLKYYSSTVGDLSGLKTLPKTKVPYGFGSIGINTAKAFSAAKILKGGGQVLLVAGVAMNGAEMYDGYIRNDAMMMAKGGVGLAVAIGTAAAVGLGVVSAPVAIVAAAVYVFVVEPAIFNDKTLRQ